NFLLVTEHAPVPADPDAPRFVRSWIESSAYDGRMLIEGDRFRRDYLDGHLASALLRGLDLPGPWRPIADVAGAKQVFAIDDDTLEQPFAIVLGAGRDGKLVVELSTPEPTVNARSEVAEWLKLADFLGGLIGGGTLEGISSDARGRVEGTARSWRDQVERALR